MTRFAVGLGILFIAIESIFMILEGGAPFWPMWAKNYLVGFLLIVAGLRAFRSKSTSSWACLVAAWGFSSGVFLISTLAIIQIDRPVEIAFALGVYTLLCLLGLTITLRNSPSE